MVKEESYSDDDVQESIDRPVHVHVTKPKETTRRKQDAIVEAKQPTTPQLVQLEHQYGHELIKVTNRLVDTQGNKGAGLTVRAIASGALTISEQLLPTLKQANESINYFLKNVENMEAMYRLQQILLLLRVDPETDAFLHEHGLKLGDDRKIPKGCDDYVELPRYDKDGNFVSKSHDELVSFMGDNPHYELGLYRITTKGVSSCYYIEDLYFHVQQTPIPEPFTKKDRDEITDWYLAYRRFLHVVKDHPKVLNKFKHVSTLLAPDDTPVTAWNSLKRQIKSMFWIVVTKVLFDLAYAIWCFVIKGIMMFFSWQQGYGWTLTFEIIWDFLVGELLTNLFAIFQQLTGFQKDTQDAVQGYFEWAFSKMMSWMPHQETISKIYNELFKLTPETQKLLFAGLGAMTVASGAAYFGYISGASFLMFSSSMVTQGPSVLAESIKFELNTGFLKAMLEILNPHKTKGLSWLMTLLIPSKLCEIIPWTPAKQACRMFTRTFAAMVTWLGPARVIVDFLIDIGWMPKKYVDWLGPSRCMQLFQRAQNYKQTLTAHNISEARKSPQKAIQKWFDEWPDKDKDKMPSYWGTAEQIFGENYTDSERTAVIEFMHEKYAEKRRAQVALDLAQAQMDLAATQTRMGL